MSNEPQIASKAAFARLCNVTPGRVSQWIRDGQIRPESMVGTGRHARIDVAKAKAHLKGYLDTAMARNEASGGTNLEPSPATSQIEGGPAPDPADYRNRADLPDDFARGMLYGAHAIAHDLPCLVASTLCELGLTPAETLEAYREGAEDADVYIVGPCAALGLLPEESMDAGPYSLKSFGGFRHWPDRS